MSNEILYVLLPECATHEGVYLSEAIRCDEQSVRSHPKYVNKVVAPTMEPVRSCSGFLLVPDYSFESVPDDFAALVLIGGYAWDSHTAQAALPTVRRAFEAGKPVGAICNAVAFLAKQGFLNRNRHTGNSVEQLKLWGGDRYTNESGFAREQAVRDGHLVTANGSAALEFAREMLLLLENEVPARIDSYYHYNKQGLCSFFAAP
jgi:putative intracellular protease/amidase